MSLQANGEGTANVRAQVLDTMKWMDNELAQTMNFIEVDGYDATAIAEGDMVAIDITSTDEPFDGYGEDDVMISREDYNGLGGQPTLQTDLEETFKSGAGVYHEGRDGKLLNAESLQGLTAAQFDNQAIKNVGDAVAGVNENQTSITATIVRSLKG